jgi:Protein of unknown function (DUF3177)
MSQELLRSLVWTDFRLAVLFTVICPIILTVWALVQKAEAMQRLLLIYWRVASLLAITLYLLIGNFPISFITGTMARVLIPISLWFWIDLNEEIREQRDSALKLAFTSWRWAVSVYNLVGFVVCLPVLRCAIDRGAFDSPFCQVWREAPLVFKQMLHGDTKEGFLGFWGILGLGFYVISLGYFVLFRLGKQGRSALEQ